MEDERIVALYWQRDELAVQQTEKKYGRCLTRLAYQILANWEDSQETVNDTYIKAWNSIPPHRPRHLSTYLGKLTRQTAIDRYRKRHSEKRKGSEYAVSLAELEDCVSMGDTTAREVDLHLLGAAISAYLRTLAPEARRAFVGRYYFMDPIREIAAYQRVSESKVKSMLYRARIGLRAYLEQEGFEV